MFFFMYFSEKRPSFMTMDYASDEIIDITRLIVSKSMTFELFMMGEIY